MKKYIGYSEADKATPYAKFYDETFSSMSDAVSKGLDNSPLPTGKIPPLSKVTSLVKKGYSEIENGYTFELDGSMIVAVLTSMPNVTPTMWDWWFGWHGSMDNRYKLWHPKAHLAAAWQDGSDREGYVGRTSMIQEYIGKKLEKANIRFISPSELGFDMSKLDKKEVVFICARVGYTHFPLDIGWLVHQVRATEGGAEMRSRFFIGGKHIQLRANWFLPNFISKILQKVNKIPKQQAIDLMTHCSEEMNHLSAFLPNLYNQCH